MYIRSKLRFMLKKLFLLTLFICIAAFNSPCPNENKIEYLLDAGSKAGIVCCLVCCMLGIKANLSISDKHETVPVLPKPTAPTNDASKMK